MNWRTFVVNTAWEHPALWRGLKALHPLYVTGRASIQRRPTLRWVQIEATNHCNLRCAMCANPLMVRERGMMSRELLERVLREIPDGSLQRIGLLSLGEPLLHPEIEDFVRRVRPKAEDVFLSTNGLLLRRDAALMRRLIEAGLSHLHFSAEGWNAETYEQVRIGASFREFLANLKLFKKVRDELGASTKIHIQYTLVRPHDEAEIRRVFEVLSPWADQLELRPLNNQSTREIAYRPGERVLGVRCFGAHAVPCPAAWCGLTVLWDGQISLCPRNHSMDFIIGASGTPLAEAWWGAAARRLRAAHVHRRFPDACRDCSELLARPLAAVELDRRALALVNASATCAPGAAL